MPPYVAKRQEEFILKRRTKTRALSWLLSLAMLLSLLPGLSLTAFAAESPEVTLDFSTTWNIPGSYTTALGSYTNGTHSINLYGTGSNGYKMNYNYLIIGKEGSYLELPAFDFDVAKIVVTGSSGASPNVQFNIFAGNTAVSTAATGATGTTAFEIASDYQAAGNVYRLQVTNNYNIQITKIEIYKPLHTHDFTYSAEGDTITATCSADNCPLDNGMATLTIKAPADRIADGKAKAATVEGEIPGVETAEITYKKDGSAVNAEDVKEEGSYTASITLEGVTASIDFEITAPYYTITIPAKLDVANSGWNETDGISASGAIAEGKKLTVTATSENDWNLKNGENTITYYLAAAEGGAATTAWEFTDEELAAENGTTKPMGAVVEEYINKPAGDYSDTVTFTAEVKSLLNSITIGGVNSTELIYADGDTWAQIVDRNPGKIYIHGTQIWRSQDTVLYVGSTPVKPGDPINPSATYKFEAD